MYGMNVNNIDKLYEHKKRMPHQVKYLYIDDLVGGCMLDLT